MACGEYKLLGSGCPQDGEAGDVPRDWPKSMLSRDTASLATRRARPDLVGVDLGGVIRSRGGGGLLGGGGRNKIGCLWA